MNDCIYIKRKCLYEGKIKPCGKCLSEELVAARTKINALMETNNELCNKLYAAKREMPDNERGNTQNVKVRYECDRRACDKCGGYCRHTSDIRHAANFVLDDDVFIEKIKEKRNDDED